MKNNKHALILSNYFINLQYLSSLVDIKDIKDYKQKTFSEKT